MRQLNTYHDSSSIFMDKHPFFHLTSHASQLFPLKPHFFHLLKIFLFFHTHYVINHDFNYSRYVCPSSLFCTRNEILSLTPLLRLILFSEKDNKKILSSHLLNQTGFFSIIIFDSALTILIFILFHPDNVTNRPADQMKQLA